MSLSGKLLLKEVEPGKKTADVEYTNANKVIIVATLSTAVLENFKDFFDYLVLAKMIANRSPAELVTHGIDILGDGDSEKHKNRMRTIIALCRIAESVHPEVARELVLWAVEQFKLICPVKDKKSSTGEMKESRRYEAASKTLPLPPSIQMIRKQLALLKASARFQSLAMRVGARVKSPNASNAQVTPQKTNVSVEKFSHFLSVRSGDILDQENRQVLANVNTFGKVRI